MKADIIFVCNECGKQLLKWMGRCPGCGEWNSIVEKQVSGTRSAQRQATVDQEPGSVVALPEIRGDSRIRLKTGIEELDRVLGGGLVNRSVVLVGGDPGIGKTTLLMQALGKMASAGITVLYISGEESSEQ